MFLRSISYNLSPFWSFHHAFSTYRGAEQSIYYLSCLATSCLKKSHCGANLFAMLTNRAINIYYGKFNNPTSWKQNRGTNVTEFLKTIYQTSKTVDSTSAFPKSSTIAQIMKYFQLANRCSALTNSVVMCKHNIIVITAIYDVNFYSFKFERGNDVKSKT